MTNTVLVGSVHCPWQSMSNSRPIDPSVLRLAKSGQHGLLQCEIGYGGRWGTMRRVLQSNEERLRHYRPRASSLRGPTGKHHVMPLGRNKKNGRNRYKQAIAASDTAHISTEPLHRYVDTKSCPYHAYINTSPLSIPSTMTRYLPNNSVLRKAKISPIPALQAV